MDAVVSNNEKSKQQPREWIANPNGSPEIYSNFVNTSWTLFDARILFGRLKPILGSHTNFKIEEQGAVTLSWAQIKMLAETLSDMVISYELVNGKIPILHLAPTREEREKNEDK